MHVVADLIIEDENQGSARSANQVRHRPFVKSHDPLVTIHFLPTIQCAVVHVLLKAGLHHHPPPHCVQRVRDETSRCGDTLGYHPSLPKGQILVLWQVLFRSVKTAKIHTPMHHHPMHRGGKPTIHAPNPILPVNGSEKVGQSLKLPSIATPYIGCNAGMCNVERVDEDQACTTGQCTCQEVRRGITPRAIPRSPPRC